MSIIAPPAPLSSDPLVQEEIGAMAEHGTDCELPQRRAGSKEQQNGKFAGGSVGDGLFMRNLPTVCQGGGERERRPLAL